MNKLNPKAVIFDLGSTLIEYESLEWTELMIQCVSNVHRYLTKQNYDIPAKGEFIQIFGKIKDKFRKTALDTLIEWTIPQATEKLLKELNIESTNGLIDKIFDAYYKPIDKRLYIYDDTLEMLEKIKRKGCIIGLISNTIFPEKTHLSELKKFEIEGYLDFTVFSSTFGFRKPHNDIYYKAANLAGYAPSECVYIGDRYLEDYKGPTRIGMPAILKILPQREYPDDMQDTIRKITCLSELTSHLDISVD